MDRAIGKLRKHLAAEGLRQDTLLFYCGDNGTSADASLASPHRGVKGQVYEGGVLVPGLIEWPARIAQARTTNVRAHTSDLLPTLCALVGQPLPNRPLDGINLMPLLDGAMTERQGAIHFWAYNTNRFTQIQAEPYLDPELQKGTTPLAKFMGGKATRDFRNYRHPAVGEADYLGPRAIIDGHFKLVIHEQGRGDPKHELFDLQADPAEKTDLIEKQPAIAKQLHSQLRSWQQSVLQSVTGADYR
jgi:arylsulfatase A-like enzyme